MTSQTHTIVPSDDLTEFIPISHELFSKYGIESTIGYKPATDIIDSLNACLREVDQRFIEMRDMFHEHMHTIVIQSIVHAYENDYPACLSVLYDVMIGAPDIFYYRYMIRDVHVLRSTYKFDDCVIIAPIIAFIISHPTDVYNKLFVSELKCAELNDRISTLIIEAGNNPTKFLDLFHTSAASIYEQL